MGIDQWRQDFCKTQRVIFEIVEGEGSEWMGRMTVTIGII